MRKFLWQVGAVAAAVTVTFVAPRDAGACGGCFHPPPPPNENPSMVTAHRMVLSVSSQQTTLYDQIKYSGSPSEFAWVLPINGLATIGLSSDLVFETIGSMTQTSVNAPPMNCPPPPSGCQSSGFGETDNAAGGGAAVPRASDASAADAGVEVTAQETVGPYETVQLHSTDANALNTWLSDHGYVIPPDVQPIIAAYVGEHFDFLAMKLVPGAGVGAMRPVRVTTPGASPVLPLRMVAAGTGATVGITLWVLAEGRWEPQNFPQFTITANDLVWDWQTMSSNFTSVRADRENASGGRAWEIESSTTQSKTSITNQITYAYYPAYDAGADYLGVDASDAGAGETPSQVRKDDIDTLFAGIPGDAIRITRLRSDLAHAALATDLVLQAAADQSEVPLVRNVTKEANEPTCPIYQGCDYVGTGPRSQAQAAADASNGAGRESFSCSAARSNDVGGAALAAMGGFFGLALVRARRRRR